jgi:hypothetical protein
MFRVGAVEPVISVAARRDQFGRLKFGQFILHSLQGEKAETSQLPHVQLLSRIGEQKPENLGADQREQPMQQRLLHVAVVTRPLKAVKFADTSKLICPSRRRGTTAPSSPAEKPGPKKKKPSHVFGGDGCRGQRRRVNVPRPSGAHQAPQVLSEIGVCESREPVVRGRCRQ